MNKILNSAYRIIRHIYYLYHSHGDGWSFICCVGINFLLVLLLFPPWNHVLAGYDDMAWALPQFMGRNGYSYSEYTFKILGGAAPLSTGGMPFYYFLYSSGIISISTVFFLLYFTAFVALSFYSLKIFEALVPNHLSMASKMVFILLFSTIPAIAWRLNAGHLSIIYGLIGFLSGVAVFLAYLRRQLSWILFAFTVLVLLQIFPIFSYQMLHHGFFYGIPLVIALLLLMPPLPPAKSRWLIYFKAAGFTGALFLACLLLCFYYFYGMYALTHSTELGRPLHENLAFSFFTATAQDWWHSLLLSVDHLTDFQNFETYSFERNLPLGPVLLMMLGGWGILAKKGKIAVSIIFLWSIIFVLFTMNVSPISDFFINYIPLAKSFRNQGRSFLIFIYIINIVAAYVGWRLYQTKTWDHYKNWLLRIGTSPWTYFILAIGIYGFARKTIFLEIGLWIMVGTTIIFYILRKKLWWSPLCLAFFLLGLNLHGFKARAFDFGNRSYFEVLANMPYTVDFALRPKNLERAVFDFDFKLVPNLSLHNNIASINGYLPPLRRFLDFYHASFKNRHRSTTTYTFYLKSYDQNFSFFALLYAINYLYNKDEMKQIYDFPSWWFPDKGTEVVDGYMALFPAIARLVDNLAFYQKLLIIKEDEPLYKSALAKAQAKDFPPVAPDEQDAQPVITITDPNFAQHAGRPIVFATNYASILRVVGITPEGKSYNLPTFAAEGPLLGSFVAEGIKEIKITAVHPHTSWSKYMPPLGGVLLLMVAGWWLALIRRPKGIGKMDA